MDDSQEHNAPAMEQLLADVIAEQSAADKAAADADAQPAKTETDAAPDGAAPEGDAAGGNEPAGKPDGETGEEPDDEQPKRKRISGSERWKRRAIAAEAALAQRSRASDGEAGAQAIERVIGRPPREEDFRGDFLAFERAQTAYEVRKAIQEDRLRDQAHARSAADQSALQDAIDDHAERIAEFKTKVADFDDVMKAVAGKHPISDHLFRLVLDSDKSAHLAYHLARNPERIERLNAIGAVAAAREIGRLEAKLSLPNPKKQTGAPKPVTPPKGGAAPSSPERDLDAWLANTYGRR